MNTNCQSYGCHHNLPGMIEKLDGLITVSYLDLRVKLYFVFMHFFLGHYVVNLHEDFQNTWVLMKILVNYFSLFSFRN